MTHHFYSIQLTIALLMLMFFAVCVTPAYAQITYTIDKNFDIHEQARIKTSAKRWGLFKRLPHGSNPNISIIKLPADPNKAGSAMIQTFDDGSKRCIIRIYGTACQYLAAHELGHCIGLPDTLNGRSIMHGKHRHSIQTCYRVPHKKDLEKITGITTITSKINRHD